MPISKAQQDQYFLKMFPYAKIASGELGGKVDPETILSWWSWETDFGSNASSKANNHAGIKSNSKGSQYAAGQYAGYKSLDAFAKDYARILKINAYGYPEVLRAGGIGLSDSEVTRVTEKMNDSQYAEADYSIKTIIDRVKRIASLTSGGSVPTGSYTIPSVEGMGNDELKKMAMIGAAVLAVLAVVK